MPSPALSKDWKASASNSRCLRCGHLSRMKDLGQVTLHYSDKDNDHGPERTNAMQLTVRLLIREIILQFVK